LTPLLANRIYLNELHQRNDVVVRMFLSLNEEIQRRMQGGLKEFDSPASQHFICRQR